MSPPSSVPDFAVPASMQQHRFSPIVKKPPTGLKIDGARVFIVAAILVAALVANVTVNLKFPSLGGTSPPSGWRSGSSFW